MNIKALYFSPTNTTKRIVKSVAAGMGSLENEYNITALNSRNKGIDFEKGDVVVIGVPVYGGRVPAMIVPYLNTIKGNGAKAVAVITYGVRAYEDALVELGDILSENGFHVVSGGAFVCQHSIAPRVGAGRPNDNDLNDARKLGELTREKIVKEPNCGTVELPGNRPYVVKPKPEKPTYTAPDTAEICDQCGYCAEICPVGAIDFADCSKVDESKCVRCHACVRRCPKGAKKFNSESVNKTIEWLEENCLEMEKNNQMFI